MMCVRVCVGGERDTERKRMTRLSSCLSLQLVSPLVFLFPRSTSISLRCQYMQRFDTGEQRGKREKWRTEEVWRSERVEEIERGNERGSVCVCVCVSGQEIKREGNESRAARFQESQKKRQRSEQKRRGEERRKGEEETMERERERELCKERESVCVYVCERERE